MAHTPGPWKASQGLPSIGWHVGMPGRWRLIVVGRDERDEGMSDEELRANARLIAAAPELLEALRHLVARVIENGGTGDLIDSALAAIAKAEGITTEVDDGVH